MNLSPKVLAYLRASEVIARTRAEAGMYDRSTAAAINKELRLIADRLLKSARAAHKTEAIKEIYKRDPELAKACAETRMTRRYLNARKTLQKLEPEIIKQYKER